MMKQLAALMLGVLMAVCATAADKPQAVDGFVSLFDGKTLDGWKVGTNADTFKVQDGMIVVNGPGPGHLFYVGPVANHDFKNFHLKCEVMTFPQANSGIYFHTEYQDTGWPNKGFEAQVDNSHKDPKRTGGLYNVQDNFEVPAKDNEWFTYEIIVTGKHVMVKINGKTTCDWTQPDDWKGPNRMPGRVLGHGTFALQGHDPGSKVYFKNIMVKPLPD
jgi:hypothetical protein